LNQQRKPRKNGYDKMKREILSIDEELCNGCGECITGCAEGAIQLVDGKAKLVKEQFCDGFGDCIGTCPTGALKVEERESQAFSIEATKQHLMQTQGPDAVARMEAANKAHEQGKHPEPATAPPTMPPAGGCPGSRMMESLKETPAAAPAEAAGMPPRVNQPELDQWPVQIHLVSPEAPYFKNRELVVLSTCSPIASADIHWRFMRGRSIVVGCPKLDRTEGYAEKLGAILSDPSIPKVIIVRMEVPCCGGLTSIVQEAARLSGRTDLEVEEVTVRLNGDIL
jgi:ferredoxin